ncbi:MAG: deoxyribonuclease V [Oscillatoriophycideae cyanobacterium NC_groundwater_1537_Pr4_S-0.65um_50_18]|nr:deoxyribonuclease V [Oscillatoriophycideae cyanobacterium NC_groundwater_1537_Pr4_S-0.65um_50_18]
MQILRSHDWNLTVEAAIALQQSLRSQIVTTDRLGKVQTVAGVDVAFEDQGSITRAAIVTLSFPGLQVLEQTIARRPTTFPYIPGLLSFREVPAVLDALKNLKITPDLLLCDGMGIAHPRRFGIACHIGWLTDLPTIGVGKSRLVGSHTEVPNERGAWVPLQHRDKVMGDEVIGAVLRTRLGIKPLYISPGHRIGLETAIAYVMSCTTKYRLPETTRHADKLSKLPASELESQLEPSYMDSQQLSLGL